MNIVRNDALVRRNARIAQFCIIGGLLVLIGGMYVSFRMPDQFNLSLTALLIGFLLSQIGIYFSNRWGRSPRPDELLTQALKGMDAKYTIYHYTTPVSHLLLGPSGLWVLIPYHQRGTITYSNGRWKQKGGNWYLKIFAQEGLGRPDIEVKDEIQSLQKFLAKHLPAEDIPDIQAALVFTSPKAEVAISEEEQPPAETVPISKLKDAIRKTGKSKPLSMERIKQIQEALESAK